MGKLSPVAPMRGPDDGGYQSLSSRKIENGYVVSHYDGGETRETYHAEEPKLAAVGHPKDGVSSSLSRACKVAHG